jgi:hypothetical protein
MKLDPCDWKAVLDLSDDVISMADIDDWNGDAKLAALDVLARIECCSRPGASRENLPALLATLRALGAGTLAELATERLVTVRIVEEDGELVLTTPYSSRALGDFRDLARKVGRRIWDGKVYRIPVAYRPDVAKILRTHYAGELGNGPRGLFVVGESEPASGRRRAA